MLKKVSEELFPVHNFRRSDGRGWLNADETITSVTAVTVTDIATGEDVSAAMVSNAAPYNGTYVRYRLIGGARGHTYRITFFIVTSNGQKLEDDIEVRLI